MRHPGDVIRDEQKLRQRVGPFVEGVDDRALGKLLRKCPDVDLAATALIMTPRPKWVEEIVGVIKLLDGPEKSTEKKHPSET